MKKVLVLLFLAVIAYSARNACAQTTVFTYQGSLQSGGAPANGNFDFQFKLFDAVSGGTQQGSTLQRLNVPVTNGVFSVSLDFGGGTLPGADRFLDIAVTTAGGGTFTALTPRQQVNSSPYAVRSLKATVADSVAASGIPAGSANYIQNGASQQASSNFNISGNGTAGGTLSSNIIYATTQYNLGNSRVLALNPTSTFVGVLAGASNTTGFDNSFFGRAAGSANTTGDTNSFFGSKAGQSNTTAIRNSFFGASAGMQNTASDNSFFGENAGLLNTTGDVNAFFGSNAGANNSTGRTNSFFGAFAGEANTTGDQNSFFGTSAGESNSTGTLNSFFGKGAGQSNTTGNNDSFFGKDAGLLNTTSSGNSFFGASAGRGNTDSSFNSFFGFDAGEASTGSGNSFFGSAAGTSNTSGLENAFFGADAGFSNTTGNHNIGVGVNAGLANTAGDLNSFLGFDAGQSNTSGSKKKFIGEASDAGADNLINAPAIGANALVSQSNSMILGSINGVNNATADVRVGIGTTTPAKHLHIMGAGDQEVMIESSDAGGRKWTLQASNGGVNGSFRIIDRTVSVTRMTILDNGNVGIGNTNPNDRLNVNGNISLLLGSAGTTSLCQNASLQIATCSSSLRYKTNIANFTSGIGLIRRLRPISFDWKEGGMKDIGFGAEEVANVDPRFVTYNDKGEVEGVKYDRLSVAFVNAFKEQQVQIEAQQKQIEALQKQIEQRRTEFDDLKRIICSIKPEEKL